MGEEVDEEDVNPFLADPNIEQETPNELFQDVDIENDPVANFLDNLPKRISCIIHGLIRALVDETANLDKNPSVKTLLGVLKSIRKSPIKHNYIFINTKLVVLLPPSHRWCYLYLVINRAIHIKASILQVKSLAV